MWLATILVGSLLLFFLLGAGLLVAFLISLFSGLKEMGNCNNSNSLGMDLSYSEQHGDHYHHST